MSFNEFDFMEILLKNKQLTALPKIENWLHLSKDLFVKCMKWRKTLMAWEALGTSIKNNT